jgi:hypothetical protein
MSSLAVPWQQLLTVEILHLHAPKSSLYRTELVWVWFILRPTVSRPVYLGIKPPSGAYDQIYIIVRPLRVFYMGRSLWREDGSVFYNVQYTIHFTVLDLRLPQPGGPGPCIYIPQEQGGPVIPPGTGPFSWIGRPNCLPYNSSARTT